MNSRRLAIGILQKIEEGAYSGIILDRGLEGVRDKRDRALITELVYGVLRQKKRLDYIIGILSLKPLERIDSIVLLALRLGLYQLEFLDRIPARAAINETVEAVKGLNNRGGAGFTNALLRGFLRKGIAYPDDPLLYLSTFYSHPEWLVKLWLKKYGEINTLRLLKINNQPPELNVRINRLRVNEKEFKASLEQDGVTVESLPVPDAYVIHNLDHISGLEMYKQGGLIVQGAASIMAGNLLSPQPGMRVLDMAAGPGVKTTHLAQLMKNRGEIIALDIHEHKLRLLNENCQRLGVSIVKPLLRDSIEFKTDQPFDMILLDAPCSGLGLLRQKPEIKWNRLPGDLNELAVIQLKMLKNASTLLKPGGIILYSTCTLTVEENEQVIQEFISAHKGRIEAVSNYLELFPPDTGTEGFFIAKFRAI
jgi:16S rRNA (cytosine967-C5)-methyltransferase